MACCLSCFPSSCRWQWRGTGATAGLGGAQSGYATGNADAGWDAGWGGTTWRKVSDGSSPNIVL